MRRRPPEVLIGTAFPQVNVLTWVPAITDSKPERPTTLAFMDISGYTALAEERVDRGLWIACSCSRSST